MSKNDIPSRLSRFQSDNQFNTRGTICLGIFLTNKAITVEWPIDLKNLLTKSGGQVSGFNGGKVDKILKEFGIDRSVGTEAGRTSRSTPDKANIYAEFINAEFQRDDLPIILQWWVEQIKIHFERKPFELLIDDSKSIKIIIDDLFMQATKRQREGSGTAYKGVLLQHLIGAKLNLALPGDIISHHGFSVADSSTSRSSDFQIDNVAIHCTTLPNEALIAKCELNLRNGLRPLILTIANGVQIAETLCQEAELETRIEVLDAIRFIVHNLYELSHFRASERLDAIQKLMKEYNRLIDEHERDPSFKVSLDT